LLSVFIFEGLVSIECDFSEDGAANTEQDTKHKAQTLLANFKDNCDMTLPFYKKVSYSTNSNRNLIKR
jgi:hypothetical protein